MAHYPSYVDLDAFIDTAALRALDGFIAGRIRKHIEAGGDSFFLNQHRLERASRYRPGVREIWLTKLVDGTRYDYLASIIRRSGSPARLRWSSLR